MTWRTAGTTVGGMSALAAALLWTVKTTSILAVGYQPPVVFEAAPALFGLTVVSLASQYEAALTRVARALGVLATAAGVLATWSELTGEVWGLALIVAMTGVLVGLILIGMAARSMTGPLGTAGRWALALGLGTVPAVTVGGLLAVINERLLEVPLLLIACLWARLGIVMLRVDSRGAGT